MSHIKTELSDGILSIRFARADKKNAITQAMYGDLARAVVAGQDDPGVRVIVFGAEGDSFSAGNDIGDFASIAMSGTRPTDMAVFDFLKSLAYLDKPAVAAVRGRAVGIGLTLLLHCDLVVVAEDALLSTPFVNLALAPEAASTLLLPMAVGHQRAFELFALGEPIDGRTAHAWGLANRCVASAEVDAEARRLAGLLARRAPGSLAGTKRLMRDAERLWALMQAEGEVFGAQMLSPEAREAFTAFFEKRAPNFG
ncbi:enoyl-CoA hydratase [Brevundimonas aveniformis]|uniref:enoyl-CoA hydratase n=1 Tax=Brevundimonas aveniformis TaxID=370977 RepID=UPI00041F61AA|nr:enoyl-CoA hydratase [Brevundimonas aveniformis]